MFINDLILSIRAGFALLSNDYPKTIQLYKAIQKKYPKDTKILFYLYDLSVKACDWATHIDSLEIYKKNWPESMYLQAWVGVQYLRIEQAQLADQQFNYVIENYANHEYKRNWEPELFAKKAISCFRLKNYAEMEHYIQKTLEGDPVNIDAHFLNINYLYLTARGNEVPAYLEKINLGPEDQYIKKLWQADHFIHYDMELPSGLEIYREIFTYGKNYTNVTNPSVENYFKYFWATRTLLYDYVDLFTKCDPDYVSSKKFRSLIDKVIEKKSNQKKLLAFMEHKLGKSNNAEKIFRRELFKNLYPIDQVDNYLSLAEIYLDTDRLSEAKEMADKSLAIYPFDPSAKKILGNILLATENYMEAKEIFEKLVTEDIDCFSNYVDHLSNLGKVYVALNEVEQAKQTFEKLISVHPKNALAREMLERLS